MLVNMCGCWCQSNCILNRRSRRRVPRSVSYLNKNWKPDPNVDWSTIDMSEKAVNNRGKAWAFRKPEDARGQLCFPDVP